MPDTDPKHPEIHVLQMEQHGNAIALVFPDRTLGVIDWGIKRANVFSNFLDDQKIVGCRFVLATHSHADHTVGLPNVLQTLIAENMPPDNVVVPATGPMTLTRTDHIGWTKDFAERNKLNLWEAAIREITPYPPERPFPIANSNDWEVDILAPSASKKVAHEVRAERKKINPGNPTSMVLLFRFKNHTGVEGRAVFPGDATLEVLRFADEHASRYSEYGLDNDVIVAPHHGSKHNWPDFLFDRVKGSVIVSTGPKSPHHPSPDFLEPVSKHCSDGDGGSRLFCTSYNFQCRSKYGKDIAPKPLVQPGPCFGDIRIELRTNGSRVSGSDGRGEERRKYGYCGQ